MFTDIKTSRDAMQQFKQQQSNAASTSGAADDIDLAVQVRQRHDRLLEALADPPYAAHQHSVAAAYRASKRSRCC